MEKDLQFGFSEEDRLLRIIQENFGETFEKTPDHHPYDYTDGETYIELKSRRCNHNTYPDTMIGYNKLKYAMNRPENKFIFLFNFKDGIYKHEFCPDKAYKIKQGGRSDRGKLELNQYAYIPVYQLTHLFTF